MQLNDEFRKYAVKHLGLNGLNIDRYQALVNDTSLTHLPQITAMAQGFDAGTNAGFSNMTRAIIEERPTNFREIDVFSRLMADRIIFLGTQVESNIANIIVAQLLFLDSADAKKDILLYINSPGGSVYDGLGIYDTMQWVRPDVATICTSLAASMGAVLLCAGAAGKRSGLQHARVMIHQPSGGAQGTSSDIEISFNEIMKIRKELYEIIAKHSNQPFEKVEKDSDSGMLT